MFSYNNYSYTVIKSSYLHDLKMGGGQFSTIKIKDKISPYKSTAIDYNKRILFKKIHQEFLERYRIAVNNIAISNAILCQDIINQRIIKTDRDNLGYGYNDLYGNMDTTGTASGLNSQRIINKAILELIEINDAMLLWYKGLGYSLAIDSNISKLIKKTGFSSDKIFIFVSNNLSNCNTFTVVCFKNKKLAASGVNSDMSSYKALFNALTEAKLIEALFNDQEANVYKNFTLADHIQIYERVNNFKKHMKKYHMCNSQVTTIKFPQWLKSLEIGVLNTKLSQDFISIRCFSKDLINSIPLKSNILNELDKTIFNVFNIDYKTIKQLPDCIII